MRQLGSLWLVTLKHSRLFCGKMVNRFYIEADSISEALLIAENMSKKHFSCTPVTSVEEKYFQENITFVREF